MPKAELNKEYIESIKNAIANVDAAYLTEKLVGIHHADIAEIMELVSMPEATFLYNLLDDETGAAVLLELDDDDRERFLENLSSKQIAQVIENIDSDDAADVIAELSEKRKEEVISHIEDEEQASDIVQLLNYDEDSAGGLMAKELVKVRADWTIAHGIREMRKQAKGIDTVYSIYVVDETNKLLGTLSLNKLLFSTASLKMKINELFDPLDLITIHPDQSSEEAAYLMQKYDLVVLPVVNAAGMLLGKITIDDVVDVIQEEAEKDYQLASGISEDVESDDSVWRLSRARLPWLLIGLMGGILISRVISIYENTLHIDPKLAFFIPLIAAMGGNVGVQSSAIVVQGLASGSIYPGSLFSRLIKELAVGLFNGFICAAIILSYNLFFADSKALSYTVAVALFCVIIFAALMGTAVPLVLNKLKIDPALATGPFITTINDLVGLVIYFYVGHLMYVDLSL